MDGTDLAGTAFRVFWTADIDYNNLCAGKLYVENYYAGILWDSYGISESNVIKCVYLTKESYKCKVDI